MAISPSASSREDESGKQVNQSLDYLKKAEHEKHKADRLPDQPEGNPVESTAGRAEHRPDANDLAAVTTGP